MSGKICLSVPDLRHAVEAGVSQWHQNDGMHPLVDEVMDMIILQDKALNTKTDSEILEKIRQFLGA